MPFIGIGLHFLVAVFFAVHAVRSGQQSYWLFVLFSFPLLGSVVYFLAIYLPSSRLERHARRAMAGASRMLDPGRALRAARAAYDYTPSAHNQLQLAAALLAADQPVEAAELFEACLQGALGADLEIRLGAARARLACRQYAPAIGHLERIRAAQPEFRAELVALLRAQALCGAGRNAEARAEFDEALARFGSFEVYAEYFLWAVAAGELQTAAHLHAEIQRRVAHWDKATRDFNRALLRRLETAAAALPPGR